MKKIFLMTIICTGMLFMASCINSLQPLVNSKTIITDNRVTGNWVHNGTAVAIEPMMQSKLQKVIQQSFENRQLTFSVDADEASRMLPKMYLVSFTKDKVSYYMAARLTKLDNNLFMDLCPVTMNDTLGGEDTDPYSFNQDYLSGFTIAKVEINGNSGLTLKFLDSDFIQQQIHGGRMRLKHEFNELFGSFIITASTGELQAFVSKYANDERLFNKGTTVTLSKKS